MTKPISFRNHQRAATSTNRFLRPQVRFVLFLKILLKRLEQSGDSDLHHQAKMIVSICARQKKTGNPQFSLLVDSVDVPLRELVGEEHWIRAHSYMRYYVARSLQAC
jgi:hypothetical protein